MNIAAKEIKIAYVEGLQDIVLAELKENGFTNFYEVSKTDLYLPAGTDVSDLSKLGSISRIYFVRRDQIYNPGYVSRHKIILGSLIEDVLSSGDKFKTFSISAAGRKSEEMQEIRLYVQEHFSLETADEADLKMAFGKTDDVWELSVQTGSRPLSLRPYKVRHMSGAMDPTLAYALNSLCELENKKSYLNILSGSGTLAIEAALHNPSLEKVIGFDNDKQSVSDSVQNIKEAGLIRRIEVKHADIFDSPELGKFDAVTSDLPFGMVISKDEDLQKLYQSFLDYSDKVLDREGVLGLYTPKTDLIEELLESSAFKIIKKVPLKLITSLDSYIYPAIYICKRK